ncbi:hypothetical protein HRbin36_02804 [bacterium HR36]|nr:hypothetical protein HRbin36_02804 [bacterium HR36]
MREIFLTVVLLTLSNIFMTFAWYGHLRYKQAALWSAILGSWMIAFFEYCLQVPANRIGHARMTVAQLKILQEVITLLVFSAFSVWYLREEFKWNYLVAFLLVIAAVAFVFKDGLVP